MRELLRQNNHDLINEIEKIEDSLSQKENCLPSELEDFYNWLLSIFSGLKDQLNENLINIFKNEDDILADILSETNYVARAIYSLNKYFLNPILRIADDYNLCLKFISWLHKAHTETTYNLFAISDGSFASLPDPPRPTIYFVPPSSQRRLLYLPLLLHEFGHLLYALHKDEMDILVKELQEEIMKILQPSVHRNDDYSEEENKSRKVTSEIWYEWTQEIFCDAVGLTIGGPAFLHSFSMHFRMLGRDEFQLPRHKLAKGEHPVTWIRIKVLANRARNMGLAKIANEIEDSWLKIAEKLEITEDYFGFYTDEFLTIIQTKIDDLLIEAYPLQFDKSEIETSQEDIKVISPIKLLNLAWEKFYSDQCNYNSWENNAIQDWISN